jgi:multiple sugar transport system permease protein
MTPPPSTQLAPTAPAKGWVQRRRARRAAAGKLGWLLSAPALVILLAMTVAPTVYLVYESFFNYTLLGSGSRFVGLQNYGHVFSNSITRHDFLVTLLFVVIAVAIEMVIGLLLAVPLAARTVGNSVASTLLLLPFAVTPAVSALIWRQLLDPNFGWLDYYAHKIGVMGAPVPWLSHSFTSWVALIGLDVWQWTPFVALILMAGLQGVPAEPREAAEVDGASPFQSFVHITLPLLRPFIAIALLLRLVEAFKTFATVQVLTGGGPGNSTELVNLTIYRVALQDFSIGAAAALGIVFLILLALLVPAVLRLVTGDDDLAAEV